MSLHFVWVVEGDTRSLAWCQCCSLEKKTGGLLSIFETNTQRRPSWQQIEINLENRVVKSIFYRTMLFLCYVLRFLKKKYICQFDLFFPLLKVHCQDSCMFFWISMCAVIWETVKKDVQKLDTCINTKYLVNILPCQPSGQLLLMAGGLLACTFIYSSICHLTLTHLQTLQYQQSMKL